MGVKLSKPRPAIGYLTTYTIDHWLDAGKLVNTPSWTLMGVNKEWTCI